MQLAVEGGRFGIQDYQAAFPAETRGTLQRELQELVARGVLQTAGATRNLSYSLRENI